MAAAIVRSGHHPIKRIEELLPWNVAAGQTVPRQNTIHFENGAILPPPLDEKSDLD
jgi:hypothetical protein